MLMKHVQEEHGGGIGGLLMARPRHDQAAAHEAFRAGINSGLTPKYLSEVGRVDGDQDHSICTA
jgi:hypothetical protein